MTIAVNTRFLIRDRLEGIGWFTYEILKRITCEHPEHHFIFFFDRPYSREFIFSKNITPVVVSPQARHPFLFWIWFELSIPYYLNKYKADIFISTDGFCSLKTKVPTLLVIHDLAYLHFPESLSWLVRKYYEYFTPRFVKKARQIVTVSEFSANDIINTFNISAAKINVVYNGVNNAYEPISDEEMINAKKKFAFGNDYFLFVGALQPRKNVEGLLRSFERFRQKNHHNIHLVIVGRKAWQYEPIFHLYHNHPFKNDIHFFDHLPPGELKNAYGAAKALVFISKFEGFGIPIIEAFRCKCPVITSNVTSMPEIAGNAAIIVEPENVIQISSIMHKILEDNELHNKMISNGLNRSLNFSWDDSARKMWSSLMKVLDEDAELKKIGAA